ncbi:protein TonB [Actimicrobium sp. GrIS 1.19]|uniref:energy transducer TonB family protein n=1 Tax=Actimicrobium sp. GrIS 1.19 TaxID=3071708 RepID=UPI002E0A31FC|nr:protein TonB [Actimicrobium sp. GrIS 1.19]
MKLQLVVGLSTLAAMLAACSTSHGPVESRSDSSARVEARVETTRDGTSTARTLAAYKEDLAQRICETNSTKVYVSRPQALLRGVIVVKFVVDANGKLISSEITRGNRDGAIEATALASLRSTAPFPKPASNLLRNGRVELSETWLFNNDGRFQIRSIAQPQMSE